MLDWLLPWGMVVLMVLMMLKCCFCAAGYSAIAGNDDGLSEGAGKTLVGG